MSISINKAIGIHDQALAVRARRLEILASNMANADTPNYKARDIDFRAALTEAEELRLRVDLSRTHERHLEGDKEPRFADALYRVPSQPSLDGNTVDPQLEQAAFTENTVQYQASLEFLNRKITGLRGALRGE